MENINNKPQERAIIGIIQDSIIWQRVSNGMFEILNAFHPEKCENEFQIDYKYRGFENALILMGLDNEELNESLGEIFNEYLNLKNPKHDIAANELAETIYIEWLVCIKNYCVTLKTVA